MTKLVLLDNTVLTNFALINEAALVLNLWPGACTTPVVKAEYQIGVSKVGLPPGIWNELPVAQLTSPETVFANNLSKRLGAGERTCIAVAYHRDGLFASDDYDARRQARNYGVPTTGTIGILLLNVQQERITLLTGNALLSQLIGFGYRSPISSLNDLAD